ncbi:hypothetical protein JCM10213v2_007831 [Rhodosporidiobolus nylandii]
MAGTQLMWSVQNGYGTPYMKTLGVPEQYTALIWLATPLAGLLVQATLGPLSDETPGRFRRRSWLAASTVLTITSLFYVAYAPEFARAFSPDIEAATAKRTTIAVAIAFLWIVNFALNGMQATVRDLLLDRAPSAQQPLANAWASRVADVAAVLGYLAGYFRLSSWHALSWMGSGDGSQFRKLSFVSSVACAALIALVCFTQGEKQNDNAGLGAGSRVKRMWADMRSAVKHLPLPVRRVCYVQFLAWMGYNSILIYSSTYISSLVPSTPSSSADDATRQGSLALVLYSLVALLGSIFFPFLCTLGSRPIILSNLLTSSAGGRAARKVLAVFTPRNTWTLGLLSFAAAMGGTFAVNDVRGGQACVAATGVGWALGEWVPYALVLETVRELEQPSSAASFSAAFSASPGSASHDLSGNSSNGGTLLGLHALSIVFSKTVFYLFASVILRLSSSAGGQGAEGEGKSGAVWVLRFGGAMCLVAAGVSRFAVEPTSERRYKARLAGEAGEEEDGYEQKRAVRRQ